ncbi:MAG: hypothetical protein GEV06_09825 [Luteitalea sp.]|nr:hypothetical protein [Luteitalea sp.]
MLLITLLSLAAAVAAAVLAWRVTQEAQRRSDARVAVLMAEIGALPSHGSSEAVSPGHADGSTREPGREPHAAPPVPAETAGASSPISPTDDPETFVHDEKVLVSTLFAQQTAPGAARPVPLWALVVGVAVLLGGGLVAVSALSSSSGARQPAATAAASAPLELLSLEHEQERDTVVVSGVVRNPADADVRRGITAVVFFFDTQGRPLRHTGAPDQLSSLAPGTEAPFTVRASLPAGASRLRVSFRQNNGSAAPHVDLRRAGGAP